MKRVVLLAAVLGLCACGGDEEATAPPVEGDVVDVRVEVPAETSDTINFVAPEFIIEPGTEKMLCLHGVYDGNDIGVVDVDMLQGKYGHHAVILRTTDPQPAGTIEDCTDQKEMAKYQAFLIPTGGLPDGYAMTLDKGQHWVLQSHYVNTNSKPIRVRDVVRLHTMPAADITEFVSTFTTVTLDYEIPLAQKFSVTFDCEMNRDAHALYLGGHMHEQGHEFEMWIGPDADSLESVYKVEDWKEEYRDAPPVLVTKDEPMLIPSGSIIRTKCIWNNRVDEPLTFPAEMCVGFGMIAGDKELYDCRDTDHLDHWVDYE